MHGGYKKKNWASIFQIPMYCVMAPVAAVSAGALTFLVLPINEIILCSFRET